MNRYILWNYQRFVVQELLKTAVVVHVYGLRGKSYVS